MNLGVKTCAFLLSFGCAIGCVSPRSHSIFNLDFSAQPPRAFIRGSCGDETFTTQGLVVCEQKIPSAARISVKIPPLPGKVIYSNGSLKRTDDFNWYPKEGFFLWKKVPIKDTWVELDLGQINALFGDWPVALDIAGVSDKTGVFVTRGILYHRICNDREVPCSKLVVEYECGSQIKHTAVGKMGKCARVAGGPLAMKVILPEGYGLGSKVYIKSGRSDFDRILTVDGNDERNGYVTIQIPEVLIGPTLYGIRLAGYNAPSLETRVLSEGFDPKWTGMDQPHVMDKDKDLEWVAPVQGDLLEVNVYKGQELQAKAFTEGRSKTLRKPGPGEIACAFAWQRDSSDQTAYCQDASGTEVKVP